MTSARRHGRSNAMKVQEQSNQWAALDIKVDALETDVREVKDSLVGLDAKIEKSVASLAHEFRASITALSNQLSERQRTPWAVIFSGMAVVIGVLGAFGKQSLDPVREDVTSLRAKIERLEDKIVPRVELQVHWEAQDTRHKEMTDRVRRVWDAQIETAKRQAYHEGQHNPVK